MKGVAYSFPCTFGLSISISIPVYPRTITGYKGATKIPRFTTLAFGFRASVGSLDLSLSPWIPVLIGGPCFIDLYRIGQSASNWLSSRVWRNSQAEHNHFVWTVGYSTFLLFFWSLCDALCCFMHYKNLTFFKFKKWIYIGGNIFLFRFDLFSKRASHFTEKLKISACIFIWICTRSCLKVWGNYSMDPPFLKIFAPVA